MQYKVGGIVYSDSGLSSLNKNGAANIEMLLANSKAIESIARENIIIYRVVDVGNVIPSQSGNKPNISKSIDSVDSDSGSY